ncbi:IclR family transcriptional regulator [Psychromicrobium xiongbiense]|uniref:IclR family transcriptional regulator n=1 Tax=Psychromicrobium xiongbiense TaxID=3051184 RepID=UPI002552C43D|nr:IclR family transcriptional regulator [Psychromicrobium sp. YIM S02556]
MSTASPAPAVTRAAAALDALAASSTGVMTLSDLARELDIPKSSASNLLQALEEASLVRKQGLGYGLGRKLVDLGAAYLDRQDDVREFYRFCEESPTLVNETVRIAMLDGANVIYLARYEGHPAVRFTSNIGDKMPASLCAVGKALLARLHEKDLEALFPEGKVLPSLTQYSITDPAALRASLKEVQERGYAFEDEESTLGVVCVGVAIPTRGTHGANLGLSVTALKATFTRELERRLVVELQELARTLGAPMSLAQVD